jgi:RimJ/RimL family protein N-acetyltransferase
MHLQTARLTLRPIHINDTHELFDYRSDAAANKYQGWIPETIDDVVIFIEKTAKQLDEPETWFQFVILENKTQKIIGDLGIHFFRDENKKAEIGCTLNKAFRIRGMRQKRSNVLSII